MVDQERRPQLDTATDCGQANGQQRVSLIGRYQSLLSESIHSVPAGADASAATTPVRTRSDDPPGTCQHADVRVSTETLAARLGELASRLDGMAGAAAAESDMLRARIDALERSRSSTNALLLKSCVIALLLSGVTWAYGAGRLEGVEQWTVASLASAAKAVKAVYDGARTTLPHTLEHQSATEAAGQAGTARQGPLPDPAVVSQAPANASTSEGNASAAPTPDTEQAARGAVEALVSPTPFQEMDLLPLATQGQVPPPSPPAEEPPTATDPVATQGRIVIGVNADVWIQVRERSGKVVLARILRRGEQWSAPTGPSLLLTTGNAGATEVSIDGLPASPLGGSGVVRRDIPLDSASLRPARRAMPAEPR